MVLYLILFLHQTTTARTYIYLCNSCILFCSYIKPQLAPGGFDRFFCCILFCSYIKPQLSLMSADLRYVVSYSVPTSNHNSIKIILSIGVLYLILFLHQTTTICYPPSISKRLYLILFLHQTTTGTGLGSGWSCCILFCSYIKPQLFRAICRHFSRCILFCSYIKPQLLR